MVWLAREDKKEVDMVPYVWTLEGVLGMFNRFRPVQRSVVI